MDIVQLQSTLAMISQMLEAIVAELPTQNSGRVDYFILHMMLICQQVSSACMKVTEQPVVRTSNCASVETTDFVKTKAELLRVKNFCVEMLDALLAHLIRNGPSQFDQQHLKLLVMELNESVSKLLVAANQTPRVDMSPLNTPNSAPLALSISSSNLAEQTASINLRGNVDEGLEE